MTAAALSCVGLLSACSGMLDKVFEPDPSSIQVSLIAAKQVNPDINGRASPLVTRFYELKSLSVFNNTDFFTLFEQDVALLGNELLVRDELRFQPGEEKQISRELQPDTRFIGVIAAFRDIENATWRRSLEIDLHEKTSFVVKFEDIAIDIRKTKE
jgi:type VI secretion system protein VasD